MRDLVCLLANETMLSNLALEIITWSIIGLYNFGFVISIIQFIRVMLSEERRKLSLTLLIHALLPISFFIHSSALTVNAVLEPCFMLLSTAPADVKWVFILEGFPAYLYFSVGLVIVLFWVLLYHKANDCEQPNARQDLNLLRKYCVAANVLVYTIYLGLVIAMYFDTEYFAIIHTVEYSFLIFLSAAAMLGFMVYGTMLYCKLQPAANPSIRRLTLSKKVGFLAILFTITFLLRVLGIVAVVYTKLPIIRFVARVVMLLLAEWIPSMAVLLALNPKSKSKRYSFVE